MILKVLINHNEIQNMKKILLFVFILGTNWCTAQIFVNQQNMNSSTNQYIEVWEKFNRGSGKFYVMVDYGQDSHANKERGKLKMHNNKGGVLEFNSTAAILNYFYKNGWELALMKDTDDFESYILQRRANFLMPKQQQKVEEASSSINTH